MKKHLPDNQVSPHANWMTHISQRAREISRPKCIGESPADDVERAAYIFTQNIRSDAERCGIPSHLLNHFLVSIYDAPAIPKPKSMDRILEDAKSYIRASEATTEATSMSLFADNHGDIVLAKSVSFPSGFNFRFVAARIDAEQSDPPKSPVSRDYES